MGFDVLDQDIRAYDAAGNQLATISSSKFTVQCGVTDVINSRGRLLLTEEVIEKPQEGLNPATSSITMTAWDAVTGAPLWTDTVWPPTVNENYDCGGVRTGDLDGISVTNDGRWADASWGKGRVIDLASGKVYQRSGILEIMGNYMLTVGNGVYVVRRPDTWTPMATLSDASSHSLISGNVDSSYLATGGGISHSLWSAITPDGEEVVVASAAFASDPTAGPGIADSISAFALPSMRLLWTFKTDVAAHSALLAVGRSAVLIGDVPSDLQITALDPRSGIKMWQADLGNTISDTPICAITETQILVPAPNNQLVTLDAKTGKQVAYSDNGGSCPTMVDNGVTGVARTDQEVKQLLTP
jgi:hypothetical protein